jgi:hypothetical protein
VIAAEQYDALPILKKWKPVDANEYAEEIQNKNLTSAFTLTGLSKYAATISLSPVQFVVKQKMLQPNSNGDDRLTLVFGLITVSLV